MTSDDLLRVLLIAADDVGRTFDHVEIRDWPDGTVDRFVRMRLLRESTGGLMAPCPNCADAHVEPVEVSTAPDGQQRWFIACLESMRVEVTPEMCRGWEVDPGGLAFAVARSLDLNRSPKVVVPDRLWRLGRIPWKSKTREVLLARRLDEGDARPVVAHVGPSGRAIVIVPHHIPDERIWPGHVPAVVALSQVATSGQDGLTVDGAAVLELVDAADAVAESRSVLPVDPEVKKRVVRQQLKAEIKGHLQDDVLTDAVKTQGSVRKAAAYLTHLLQRKVTKDQVQNAVKRAGGRKKLMETDDSASVQRRVASQSRDRATKSATYRN
jgi:hypothetical protein